MSAHLNYVSKGLRKSNRPTTVSVIFQQFVAGQVPIGQVAGNEGAHCDQKIAIVFKNKFDAHRATPMKIQERNKEEIEKIMFRIFPWTHATVSCHPSLSHAGYGGNAMETMQMIIMLCMIFKDSVRIFTECHPYERVDKHESECRQLVVLLGHIVHYGGTAGEPSSHHLTVVRENIIKLAHAFKHCRMIQNKLWLKI